MLSDKTCIVTGGGQGIGDAVAKGLAAAGAAAVVNDLGTSLTGEGSEPAVEIVEDVAEGFWDSIGSGLDGKTLDRAGGSL